MTLNQTTPYTDPFDPPVATEEPPAETGERPEARAPQGRHDPTG